MNENMSEFLLNAEEFISNYFIRLNNIIEHIKIGNVRAATNILFNSLQDFEDVSKLIYFLPEIQSEEINLEIFNDNLREILNALENEDYILMSDIIEFELLPYFNKLLENIIKLRKSIN